MTVALIIMLWVAAIVLIATILKGSKNCSGDCRQGRAPCNCEKEEK